MNFLSSWRVSARMRFLLVLILIGLSTLSVVALIQLKDSMLEDRKVKTKNLVETATGLLAYHQKQAQAGKVSDADAQRLAIESLRGLRYNGADYFFIFDLNHNYVLSPPKPEIEGKNVADLKDARGKLFVQEFISTAQKSDGGYVDYWFPRPGQQSAEPKLSYVTKFAPWGWVIGTGIYVDDVDTEFRNNALLFGGISICLLGILGFFTWSIGSGITKELGGEPSEAANVAAQIAAGNLDTALHLSAGDKHSMMASMKAMQDHLRELVGEIRTVVDAASRRGDFSSRINLANKQGFGKEIASGLNELAQVTETGLQDIMRVSEALAKGDLNQTITRDYPGVFGQSKVAVNGIVHAIGKTITEIQAMVDAAALRGDFTSRINLNDKSGYTRTLSEALNNLSETTNNGLRDVIHLATALAQGDLTQKIERNYPGSFGEVVSAMNATVENLTQLVFQIKTAVEAINVASSEIAMGNQDLSSRTEDQAASLEETASSLEELTGAVQQNTTNARHAAEMGSSASQTAMESSEAVSRSAESMKEISEASQKIADIIGVIDSIAFQTNILALNAAVEAARAGEQGRGFAVVATEVRNLAQRSALAAKEIKGLISDSLGRVDTGVAQANAAGETMNGVVTSVQHLSKIIGEISTASVEQSSGIEQINLAVSRMEEVTQHNAALVEQAAAAAESLEEQAKGLNDAVMVFRIRGQNTAMSPSKGPKTPSLPSPSKINTAPAKVGKPLPRLSAPKSGAAPASGEDEWAEF